MKFLSLFLACVASILSFSAFAHSGHDHSHPLASLVHFIWLLPLFILVAFGVRFLIKELLVNNND